MNIFLLVLKLFLLGFATYLKQTGDGESAIYILLLAVFISVQAPALVIHVSGKES